LTDEEAVLIDALKTVEPSIERIASLSGGSRHPLSSRGNIVLKCKGIDERIPIGTMGDGIWRMLGIAIALVTAKDGILLVDEIDTGLHYSVMSDMWRLVERTAERLNVQVFATTHSRDCYESLASIAHESITENSKVTIQRIEKEKGTTVAFTERDIVIAAERGLEVR
jgi:AAA15 family ATPase/GTPase